MKRKLFAGLFSLCAIAATAGSIEPEKLGAELEQVRTKARAGDYQAQRNLAYAYATGDQLQGKRYPVAGCAWYMSIAYINGQKFGAGDSGNVYTYCRNLPPDQFDAAIRHSAAIVGAKTAGR